MINTSMRLLHRSQHCLKHFRSLSSFIRPHGSYRLEPFQLYSKQFGRGRISSPSFSSSPLGDSEPMCPYHKMDVSQTEMRAEEKIRREMLFSHLPENSAALFLAAPETFMAPDVRHSFRQQSDFLYFTGFPEPHAAAIIRKPCLVSLQRWNIHSELWDGTVCGLEGAEGYGVTEVDSIDRFAEIGRLILHQKSQVFAATYDAGRCRSFFTSPQQLYPSDLMMHNIRLRKSPLEMKILKQAAHISCQAMTQVIRHSGLFQNERVIESQMEWECKRRGADRLAYIPVVANGRRALTIHYIKNNQDIDGQQLLLLDAGCEISGYVSDISRTWALNGKFSPAQRAVYEAVLRVQEACIQIVNEGLSLREIHSLSDKLMSEEITHLGLPGPTRRFYPHMIGHYLGMDVHDTASINTATKIERGFYITIEPGLYIPEDPDIPKEFRGIGVRIEDDVMINHQGTAKVYTKGVPKDIDTLQFLASTFQSRQ